VKLLHSNAGGGEVGLVDARQPLADQAQNADQHEGNENRDNDLGKFVMHQDEDVLVPDVQAEEIMPSVRKLNRIHDGGL